MLIILHREDIKQEIQVRLLSTTVSPALEFPQWFPRSFHSTWFFQEFGACPLKHDFLAVYSSSRAQKPAGDYRSGGVSVCTQYKEEQ